MLEEETANQLAALTAAVAALTNTLNNNHAAVMERLDDMDAHLSMRLVNATVSFGPLRGPTMAPLAFPHPPTRDALLSFTDTNCIASAAAFNLPVAGLPAAPTVDDRRRQIARFLGVGFN